jgi:hypothetical protein
MDRYGAAVTPKVERLFNAGASAISMGCAVTWAGVTAQMEDPIPEPATGYKPMLANQAARTSSLTRPVQGIVLAGADLFNHPIGVAKDDIAASAWGEIAIAGPADVRIGISSNITANDYLITTAGGLLIEDATSVTATTIVHAMALEATITSGTCAAALISAQLNFPIGGAMGKRA